jgi:hypothetical protein
MEDYPKPLYASDLSFGRRSESRTSLRLLVEFSANDQYRRMYLVSTFLPSHMVYVLGKSSKCIDQKRHSPIPDSHDYANIFDFPVPDDL